LLGEQRQKEDFEVKKENFSSVSAFLFLLDDLLIPSCPDPDISDSKGEAEVKYSNNKWT